MQEAQRENEQERGEAVEKKEKKRRHWFTFILPTDMPQKQFHNLICMGLF